MQAILDTVFSMIIGGLILISLHSLNRNLSNAASAKIVTTGVQENITSINDILEYDLRKVGYNNVTSSHFIIAESTRVYLRADFNNDGNSDSVTYYLGTSPDADQINPRARVLYRSYNGGSPVPMKLGITRMRFWYFDQAGNPLATTPGVANPSLIGTIKVTIIMSVGTVIEPRKLANGTVKYDTTFSSASWERTIKPVNLK